ncbi:hypothetical protein SAMN04488601_1012545 [Paenibacillus sp. 453mf]|nr:hypothetical protein SAMN04488601_1012545 [Paenibacillus sp. 453mf]
MMNIKKHLKAMFDEIFHPEVIPPFNPLLHIECEECFGERYNSLALCTHCRGRGYIELTRHELWLRDHGLTYTNKNTT